MRWSNWMLLKMQKKIYIKCFTHFFLLCIHCCMVNTTEETWIRRGFSETHKSCCRYDRHIFPLIYCFQLCWKKNAATQIILINRENFVVVRQGESSWQTRSFTLGFVCQNSLILLNTKKVPVVLSAIWNLLRYGGMGKQGDALRMGDMSVSC